jgi:hypothetical protein
MNFKLYHPKKIKLWEEETKKPGGEKYQKVPLAKAGRQNRKRNLVKRNR